MLTMQVTTEIDAPLDKVWDILADFTKYPEWCAWTHFGSSAD